MMAFRILVCVGALIAAPAMAETPPKPSMPDGKVTGLNADSYATLQTVRKRNPGALNTVDAKELAAAVQKDGMTDAGEADLLAEMTQSQFRSITVTPITAGGDVAAKIVLYPVAGNAKTVLQHVLNPPLDLAAEWAMPDHSWNLLVREYKASPEKEARVLAFVAEEMAKKWEVSNFGNGYKPLRDAIGKVYGLCNAPGADGNTGKTLLYRAVNTVDRNAGDAMPDFLYNWTRPGGYL